MATVRGLEDFRPNRGAVQIEATLFGPLAGQNQGKPLFPPNSGHGWELVAGGKNKSHTQIEATVRKRWQARK